jgi:hypothetical protein
MKKTILFALMVCLFLTACGWGSLLSKDIPTATTQPTITASPLATSTPTRSLPTIIPPTPSYTPFPYYQTKKVLIDYYTQGDHSIYDVFYADYPSYPRFIIYDDGQLIIPGKTYQQKWMSPSEIRAFVSKLEALGFYALESNQRHNPDDKLYDYGDNYEKSYDGTEECLFVSLDVTRQLCVYQPDMQYVIPKMKAILQFLDDYEPAGLTPYYPDRILLWAEEGRSEYDDNLPEIAIPWDARFPSLETYGSIIYVDWDMVEEIFNLFENTHDGIVVIQNGKEYTLHIDIVLPHEELENLD